MVQLLDKMKIKARSESTTLLKVIKNPFSQYLPPGTRCHGMSCQGKLYSPIAMAKALVPSVPDKSPAPTCFIVGAEYPDLAVRIRDTCFNDVNCRPPLWGFGGRELFHL